MPASEAFSRVLIDEELKYAKWDLKDSHEVRFEFHNQSGRADYLLMPIVKLSKIKFILPPLDLQHEFARRVQEARRVQSVQRRSEEKIEALYQSMLSRAFAGEL